MITAVVDYGASNLKSVEKAFQYLGENVKVTSDIKEVLASDRLVLPGNGAFADCMASLENTGLADSVKEFVEKGRPFLGICIGMQLLFEESSEFGRHKGFGLIKGKVERFSGTILEKGGKIPHIGWNSLEIKTPGSLFRDIENGSYFYFVHSYFADALTSPHVTASADYYGHFPAAIEKDNIAAVQFHPEKSLKAGLKLLSNFRRI